jgi:hypothetical protein
VATVTLGAVRFIAFFPAWLEMRSLPLILGALICEFPALVIAYIFVFKTIPARYGRREETFTTLFQAHR